MKLIVGLGNPGKNYVDTRHNIGFMVVDAYLGDVNYKEKFSSLYYEKNINGEKVVFIKPQTMMNNSGISVQAWANYYNVSVEDIFVIQDDLDEDSGRYKIKTNSTSGGHNGVNSIIASMSSKNFPRLKIGIMTPFCHDTIEYVLGKLSKEEKENFNNNIETFIAIIDSYIINGIEKTMNVYNKK